MSGIEAGQDAPGVDTTAQPLESAQVNAETTEASTDDAQVDKEAPVEKTFTQKELDEILHKRLAKAEAKAERRATQAYREALEAVTRQQPAARTSNEPTRDQFASDAEWIDAKVDYKLQQRDAVSHAEQVNRAHQTLTQKTESIYAQAEKLSGFDREAFDELPITRPIAAALVDSEVAPALMAYMTSHPEEVDRIAKLSDARQAAELGKLEMKLQQAPKTSKTPAPIDPIGSRGSASQPLDRLSFADFKAARQKQGARWAR